MASGRFVFRISFSIKDVSMPSKICCLFCLGKEPLLIPFIFSGLPWKIQTSQWSQPSWLTALKSGKTRVFLIIIHYPLPGGIEKQVGGLISIKGGPTAHGCLPSMTALSSAPSLICSSIIILSSELIKHWALLARHSVPIRPLTVIK